MEDERRANTTLVLGGTGKAGRRVTERLGARGVPARVGSRSAEPPFSWEDRATRAPALEGVGSVYVSYFPDLAIPGAVEAVRSFAGLTVESGVGRLALLSGRGEAQGDEQAVRGVAEEAGAEWTVVRCRPARKPCEAWLSGRRCEIARRSEWCLGASGGTRRLPVYRTRRHRGDEETTGADLRGRPAGWEVARDGDRSGAGRRPNAARLRHG